MTLLSQQLENSRWNIKCDSVFFLQGAFAKSTTMGAGIYCVQASVSFIMIINSWDKEGIHGHSITKQKVRSCLLALVFVLFISPSSEGSLETKDCFDDLCDMSSNEEADMMESSLGGFLCLQA